MPVVALVCNESEARPVVTWAGRFAAGLDTDLIVFFLADKLDDEGAAAAVGEEQYLGPTFAAIMESVESIVRTRRARTGRISRHDVSLRRIPDLDPVPQALSRINVESPELVVGMRKTTSGSEKADSRFSQQVLSRVNCDAVSLYGDKTRSLKAGKLLVVLTESRHDRPAVALAACTAKATKGTLTATCLEASIGEEAIEVGQRTVRKVLRDIGLEESTKLRVKAVLAEDPVKSIAEEAEDQDLLLIGTMNTSSVKRLLESTTNPQIAILRQSSQFSLSQRRHNLRSLLPRLNPTDYADLYDKLQSGSRWNVNFVFMLGLAAAIATLGLLQSSPAVVIGSMLLAPLMTPMIGMGLALNQGNPKLAYACFRSISRGFLAALAISFVVGVVTPGSELTPEVFARTEPNILDLLIALFSGVAAAYALARPSLGGNIAGVAIATALVPPLCSAGICLAYGQFFYAFGAGSLLVANVLAIILSAAATFRAMGLKTQTADHPSRRWVRRVVLSLTAAALAISIPLALAFVAQIHRGRTQPIALAVTNKTRQAIVARVQAEPGVTLLLIGRPGIPREEDPVDVGIVLSSERPLPRAYADELTAIVRNEMQDPELRVKVACVAAGWAAAETVPSRQKEARTASEANHREGEAPDEP